MVFVIGKHSCERSFDFLYVNSFYLMCDFKMLNNVNLNLCHHAHFPFLFILMFYEPVSSMSEIMMFLRDIIIF